MDHTPTLTRRRTTVLDRPDQAPAATPSPSLARIRHERPTTRPPDRRRLQPLIYVRDIPGSLCLGELQRRGVLVMLDSTAGYLNATAGSLHGRALIAGQLMPKGTTAAGLLALWVWRGGRLPRDITVLTRSHFRSTVFGRRICPQDRTVDEDDLHRVGSINVTSPLRTACDVACLPQDQFDREVGLACFSDFLQFYELSLPRCRAMLTVNPRWPGLANGLALLERLESVTA